MAEYNLFLEFILTGFIFISFFVIISIFGFSLLYILYIRRSDSQQYKLTIKDVIISFGIGISIYISFAYLLSYFNIFNLFTGYLLFCLYDFILIVFFIIKRGNFSSNYLKNKIHRFFGYVKIHSLSFFILFLIFFISFILFWTMISKSIGLMKRDPYLWIKNIYLLLENQSLDLENLGFEYPSGFVFVSTGFLLVWSADLQVFFFLKLASIYYFWLYLTISFLILKQIFKKNYLILFSLILLLFSNHFLSRFIINISSSLAALLILMSFLIILNDYPDYLLGFFITGIYLINPLSCLFYLILISIYILYDIFKHSRNKIFVKKKIKSLLFLVFIAIILLIPYILTYPDDTLDLFNWFDKMLANPRFHSTLVLIFDRTIIISFLLDLDIFNLNIFTKIIFNWWLKNLALHTILNFILFSIAGIFMRNKRNRDKVVLFKISFILVLFFTFIPYFIDINFFKFFRYRSLEAFALGIPILASFTISWIVNKAKHLSNYFSRKISHLKTFSSFKKTLTLESIFIFILLISSFSTLIERDLPEYYYHYDDEYVKVVLYLRQNAQNGSIIYHPNFGREDIGNVLYDMENHFYNLSEIFIEYKSDFVLGLSKFNYLIANKSAFPEEWRYFKYVELTVILNFNNFILYENIA